MSDSAVAAIDGWFTMPASPDSGEGPSLIGARCDTCTTYVFPPRDHGCPNPNCPGDTLTRLPLSRQGRVWSYTENRYAPPPPYPAPDPFQPYALAAVQLDEEGLIVLAKVAAGVLAEDLEIGMPMQTELEPLYRDDEGIDHLVHVWAPAPAAPRPTFRSSQRLSPEPIR